MQLPSIKRIDVIRYMENNFGDGVVGDGELPITSAVLCDDLDVGMDIMLAYDEEQLEEGELQEEVEWWSEPNDSPHECLGDTDDASLTA
ncbi:hypothetical protein NDU88_001907 [Pleurodeles waltl]|uniref:Uncharacterized protein n=1 Tax=Pleurodeles waltl TaxID=8319 RepID=A0AAV7S8X4_PLEWA|nr:hypothetical protein NDU88_001907 [Pleurodeles waltl]